jgi:(p)ppGpp synthase/HD superfamily hydrolase
MLSERFDAALALAHQVHRRQMRKGSQVPYIGHLLGVASIVIEYGGNETEAIAALLHDALEDAPDDLGVERVRAMIAEQFGLDVLAIVEHCSDTTEQPKPPWPARKRRYIAAAEHAPRPALFVSAADKLHNVCALMRDYRREGDALWIRLNAEAGKARTVGYYRALADLYLRRLPGPLADDLARFVHEFEEITGLGAGGGVGGGVRP